MQCRSDNSYLEDMRSEDSEEGGREGGREAPIGREGGADLIPPNEARRRDELGDAAVLALRNLPCENFAVATVEQLLLRRGDAGHPGPFAARPIASGTDACERTNDRYARSVRIDGDIAAETMHVTAHLSTRQEWQVESPLSRQCKDAVLPVVPRGNSLGARCDAFLPGCTWEPPCEGAIVRGG